MKAEEKPMTLIIETSTRNIRIYFDPKTDKIEIYEGLFMVHIDKENDCGYDLAIAVNLTDFKMMYRKPNISKK